MDINQITTEIYSETEHKLEFSKCGEIFVRVDGSFRWDCILCELKYENNYDLQFHILQYHVTGLQICIKNVNVNTVSNNISSIPIIDQKIAFAENILSDTDNFDNVRDRNFLQKYNIKKQLKVYVEKYSYLEKNIKCGVNNRNNLSESHNKNKELYVNKKKFVSKSQNKLKPIVSEEQISNCNVKNLIYKCKLCSQNFSDEYSLKTHTIVHTIKLNKPCNSEQDVFLEKCRENNLNKKRSDSKEFNQEIPIAIKKKFTENRKTKIKAKMRKNEKHICEICGKESTTKYNLNSHIKLKHGASERRKFSCNHCGKEFVRDVSLQNHIKTVHLKEKPFLCNIDKCDRRFVDQKALKNHQAFHISERKFICSKCGKKYLHKSKLDAHFKMYHVLGRIHQCKECTKSFYDPYTLRNHMVCHTGERPFECDECPAKFPRENALQWHKKVHSGIKDHICKICGQTYYLFTGLYAHMKTHGIKYNKKIEKGLVPIEQIVSMNIKAFKIEDEEKCNNK